jgi:hypothetical protein
MCLGIGNLKFIDSFQFMNESLEKLTENLYDKMLIINIKILIIQNQFLIIILI